MQKKVKIVIVEDEPISTAYLKKLIRETEIEHEIVAELDSVSDSVLFFGSDTEYDIIFMDIHLGDGTCFEILNTIKISKPIIFCTTFDTYAIEAFNYNSIDYILKPAKLNDIEDALSKYYSIKKVEEESYAHRMGKMMDTIAPKSYKKRFLIRTENKLNLVDVHNICCIYSEDGHTHLVDKSGKEYVIDFTLEKLEELLNPEFFFRINRKLTLNIDEIKSVEDYPNNRLIVELDHPVDLELVVSRNRVKDFKNWLKGIL